MRLREITVFADEAIVDDYQGGFVQRFHRESLCVTESFQWAFEGPLLGKIDKVQITACAAGRAEQLHLPLNLWLAFDFAQYVIAMPTTKKVMLGNLVRRGLDAATEQAGWAPAVIAEAHAKAMERDFIVRRRVGKRWPSPNRRRRVEVDVTWDIAAVRFDAVVSQRVGKSYVVQETVEIGTVIPTDGCVEAYTQGAKWLTEDVFCLESTGFPAGRLTVELRPS